MKAKISKTLLLAAGVCAIFVACAANFEHLTAQMPDLSQKDDGVYRGTYDLSKTPVKVTLDVSVQDGKITKIEILEHSRSPIGKKSEKIIDRIVENQTLDVDVVSGATASSKTILKAVENALQ